MPSATPNVADFATWVTNVMRVPAAYLPAGSPYLGYALNQALAVANLDLACLPTVPGAYTLYDLACYNLAGALLAEYAPDQSYPIASVSWAGGAASVTTAGPNAVQPGDSLVLNGISPAAYNGPLTAYGFGPVRVSAVPSATQFSYPLLPQPPGLVNVLPGAAATETYFATIRRQFKLASTVPGVIASTSDLSTSVSLDNPDFMKGLTLENLQLLKTPWGRAYLSIAQKYGPTIWGLS